MHACSKSRARIDMQYFLVCILRPHRLPRRDHKQIVYVELVKILFPVVDPVNVFRLRHRHRAFPYLHKKPQSVQLFFDLFHDSIPVCRHTIHFQTAVFFLFYKKAQISYAVILRSFRQDIYEHLLLLQRRQWNLILDLRAFQSDIIESAYDDIFRLRNCLDPEFCPFHTDIHAFLSVCCDLSLPPV